VIATLAVTAVVAWLLLASPFLGHRSFKKLLAALDTGEPGVRVRFYKQWVRESWLLVAIVLLVSGLCGWTPAQLGFVWPHSTSLASIDTVYTVGTGMIIGLAIGMVGRLLIQRRKGAQSTAETNKKSQLQVLRMFPKDAAERRWYAVLAITAGIGEEIVWRGFGLCVLFACHIHQPAVLLIALLAIPFGWAHLYQGFWGIVAITIVGAVFAALYVATGSLLLPMILHMLFDLRMLLMRFDLPQGEEGRLQQESS
jgi:uncharacterized protein